jgi:indolepyruvate decarboxylase
MDALYPRYAAFIRPGDNVVLETGSSTIGMTPIMIPDDVQVHADVNKLSATLVLDNPIGARR